VAKKFAKLLGMDPWLINPMFARCGEVSLGDAGAAEGLKRSAEALLAKIRRKYKEYGIQERPFVVVKSDTGGPGIGAVTVRDPSVLTEPNFGLRSAEGADGDLPERCELILQEGVPTYERIDDAVAEPVVYMIDRYVVGGFYRVQAGRGVDETLNASGSTFVPLAFAEPGQLPRPGVKPGASAPNRFYMYGVIARLAMLAASYELEATDPQAEVYA